MISKYFQTLDVYLLMADDCLPPQFREDLLLRILTFKLDESTTITDP